MAYPGFEAGNPAPGYGGEAYGGYGYPPAPMYAPPPVPYGGGAPQDELRTVFITGFPNDVKERELNNLLRFLPGYEASQMNWKNGQAQGFALFATGHLARAACDVIIGMCFDDGVHLRGEMARKNMYIRDEMAGPPGGGGAAPGKRPRTTGTFTGAGGGGGGFGGPGAGGGSFSGGGGGGARNVGDNPPCNTLFVGNLGDAVSEDELRRVFGAHPGFSSLKVLRGGRGVSCFVEYDTIENAAAVHSSQQGLVVASSDRGPLRIQFSKNPLGRKRDAAGQQLAGGVNGAGGYEGAPPAL